MPSRWLEFPALRAKHLRGARLYADRVDLISALPILKGGAVAEIGVWQGTFSKVLISMIKPRRFLAFDIFTGHEEVDWNGLTGRQLFDGLTHRQYYEREMAPFRSITTVIEGQSKETLRAYTDRSFDLVYVDGNHHYDFVKADAELATEMTKDSGFLVFNDYIIVDRNNVAYGVVPVVNDLVVNRGWRVVGFAIDHLLHSDIALQREGAGSNPLADGSTLLSRIRVLAGKCRMFPPRVLVRILARKLGATIVRRPRNRALVAPVIDHDGNF